MWRDSVVHTQTHTQCCETFRGSGHLLVAGEVARCILAQDEGGLVKVSGSGPLGFVPAVESMVVEPLDALSSEVHCEVLCLYTERKEHTVFQSLTSIKSTTKL